MRHPISVLRLLVFTAACAVPADAFAQDNLPGRMIFITAEGEVRVASDGKIDLATAGESVTASRAAVEVGAGRAALVLSNNTGLSLAAGARMEFLRFEHAPFAADPMRIDDEPTVSRLEARVRGGRAGVCLPRQVFGSTVLLHVPQAVLRCQGRKFVLEVSDERTVVAAVDGMVTVLRGPEDRTGTVLHSGQSAVITPTASLDLPAVAVAETDAMPRADVNAALASACLSRNTVFFAAPSDPRRLVTPPTSPEQPNPTVSLDRFP